MAVSVSYREAYRHHRRVKGKPRERITLYLLRLLLGPDYTVRRVPVREQMASKEHKPDIRVFHRGRLIAEVEVTGLLVASSTSTMSASFAPALRSFRSSVASKMAVVGSSTL